MSGEKPPKENLEQALESQPRVVSIDEVWPQERDFMSRPDRYKYVRKLVKPEGCVFCNALKKGTSLESLVLFKGKTASVIQNKFPYNSGHVLVIPNAHKGSIEEFSKEEFARLNSLLHETILITKKVYECEGINVGLNLGAVAGAGIPDHLHWHVIPRWFGDTNFFPVIAETKALPETEEQAYNRYSEAFKELKGEF